jgi:hypothetical protein
MKDYRDKFVADLDELNKGQYPHLDIPKKAVSFLYSQLVKEETDRNRLSGIPLDFDAGFKTCEEEAAFEFKRVRSRSK